jgi:hypothetical protein
VFDPGSLKSSATLPLVQLLYLPGNIFLSKNKQFTENFGFI